MQNRILQIFFIPNAHQPKSSVFELDMSQTKASFKCISVSNVVQIGIQTYVSNFYRMYNLNVFVVFIITYFNAEMFKPHLEVL